MRRLLLLLVALVPFTRTLACRPAPAPQAPMIPAESVSVGSARPAPALAPPEPKSSAGAASGSEPDEDEPIEPPTAVTSPVPTFVPSPIVTSPMPTLLPPTPPTMANGPPFDRGAAAAGLGSVNVQACAQPGGPTGSGHVTVTFVPDGSVSAAVVDAGPFPGTSVGACIALKFKGVHVPPYAGPPVRVGKSFVIQ